MAEQTFMNQETPAVDPKLEAEALAAIERDKLDPRQQMYMYDKTEKRLIRTTQQYHRAVEGRHELKYVDYTQAERHYKQEQALRAKALAKVASRKRAKQARKRSRGT